MRNFCLLLLAISFCWVVNAQTFAGVHSLQLSATGSVAQTDLTSNQAVNTFDATSGNWEILTKTQVFTFNATTPQMQVLDDIFMWQANRLMKITFNLQNSGLNFSVPFTSQVVSVPMTIEFNQKTYTGTASINVAYTGTHLNGSINSNFSLTTLMLSAATHADIFANNVMLSATNFSLPKR